MGQIACEDGCRVGMSRMVELRSVLLCSFFTSARCVFESSDNVLLLGEIAKGRDFKTGHQPLLRV